MGYAAIVAVAQALGVRPAWALWRAGLLDKDFPGGDDPILAEYLRIG